MGEPRSCDPKNHQKKIQFRLSIVIRCNTCGNTMWSGTEFDSRREEVVGETYIGIKLYRFYINCTECSAEVTLKTDPQNSSFIVESGATGLYNDINADEE